MEPSAPRLLYSILLGAYTKWLCGPGFRDENWYRIPRQGVPDSGTRIDPRFRDICPGFRDKNRARIPEPLFPNFHYRNDALGRLSRCGSCTHTLSVRIAAEKVEGCLRVVLRSDNVKIDAQGKLFGGIMAKRSTNFFRFPRA